LSDRMDGRQKWMGGGRKKGGNEANKTKEEEKEMHMDLGPNQGQNKTYTEEWERWSQLTDRPLYLGYQISYHNGRTTSISGVIYKVIRTQTEIMETWYT